MDLWSCSASCCAQHSLPDYGCSLIQWFSLHKWMCTTGKCNCVVFMLGCPEHGSPCFANRPHLDFLEDWKLQSSTDGWRWLASKGSAPPFLFLHACIQSRHHQMLLRNQLANLVFMTSKPCIYCFLTPLSVPEDEFKVTQKTWSCKYAFVLFESNSYVT